MRGPAPNPTSGRSQRRRKLGQGATLRPVADIDVDVPKFPKGRGKRWSAYVKAYWSDVWSSPMAPEYDRSTDIYGLTRVCDLMQELEDLRNGEGEFRYEHQRHATIDRKETTLAKIGQLYGLTPLDRRRLQWTIETGERAEEQTRARRNRQTMAVKPDTTSEDPRKLLQS